MVANLRVTIRSCAVWRTCECGALAPLSAEEDRCADCRSGKRTPAVAGWCVPEEGSSATMAFLDDIDGPSDAELAAIELEWPLIAAEMDLAEIEAQMLTAECRPAELDWRRLRRAERRVLRVLVELLDLTDDTNRPAEQEPRLAVAA
ncbi:DUF6284 family protein [Catellatospora coxensis]